MKRVQNLMIRASLYAFCLLVVGALTLPAQIRYPGQAGPYPNGGQYPTGGPCPNSGPCPNGGNYPGNGGGGRFPGGGGRRSDSDGGGKRGKKKDDVPTITTTGMLRVVAGNQFVLEADDHRIITYRIADTMKSMKDSKPAELESFSAGDHISVDATSDENDYFTASEVTFSSSATAEDRAQASRTWDLPELKKTPAKVASASKKSLDDDDRPTLRRSSPSKEADKDAEKDSGKRTEAKATDGGKPEEDSADNRSKTVVRPPDATPDTDDPGMPRLRRGAQVPRTTLNSASAKVDDDAPAVSNARIEVARNEPSAVLRPEAIPIEEDPIIVKAKAATAEYTGRLPNFLVKQNTTRYDSDNPKSGWTAHDMITAEVTAENGTQTYKNIKVGSRTVKSMEEAGGSWSTGEFASWLDDVFDPSSAARFRRSGQEMVNGRSSVIFKYEVTREHSHWRVSTQSQLYYPAYRGTVWIDKESFRVVRMEVEARGVPLLFPLDKVEMAMDYGFVKLSGPQPFLLPTDAEVLDCRQGTTFCVRNRIEFRNYRRFGADSDITFDDKL